MTVKKGKIVVAVVLAFLGVTFCAGYSLAGSNLDIQATCPNITSGVQFTITITITNSNNRNLAFDRATIAHINPDMTFCGPVEPTITGATVKQGQTITRTLTYTVFTEQASGTIIPIMVSLYNKRLSTDGTSFRGGVVLGAKLQ